MRARIDSPHRFKKTVRAEKRDACGETYSSSQKENTKRRDSTAGDGLSSLVTSYGAFSKLRRLIRSGFASRLVASRFLVGTV
jgi:hypothetical protein